VQAGLASAPQHVVGAAGPFALDEIAQLPLRETRAVVLAGNSVAQHFGSERAVALERAFDHRHRKRAVAAEDLPARVLAAREVASRKRGALRPGALELGEVGTQPFHDVLGEAPIGGDLAAEDG
jgi:hypothetical protein